VLTPLEIRALTKGARYYDIARGALAELRRHVGDIMPWESEYIPLASRRAVAETGMQ
jgi:hypothetical protein